MTSACRCAASTAGTLRTPGKPDQPIAFYESGHGPVVGYATVAGTRVAISSQRSTRGRELLSARALYAINTGRVTSATTFMETMAKVEFSFNWFYADDRDIALFSSGRLPVRAPGTDPALPTAGTGEYDWKGYLTPQRTRARRQPAVRRHPQLEQQACAERGRR